MQQMMMPVGSLPMGMMRPGMAAVQSVTLTILNPENPLMQILVIQGVGIKSELDFA